METRGNYILIGLFTLLGAVGLIGLLLWFARVELDQQFDYYDVRFTSVSGLSDASDVRFSGLPVGQVVDVRLSPERDGLILVRLEVDAETPVRTDSIATIEAQGVTGVSFVQIGPGTPEAPLLEASAATPVPFITAGRSVFQSVTEEAPRLITETLEVIEDVSTLLGPENQARFQHILVNAERASQTLNTTLEDMSGAAAAAAEFGAQVARFNSVLESVADDVEQLLQTTDTTVAAIGALSGEAEAVLQAGAQTITRVQNTLDAAEGFIAEDLTGTTDDLRTTLAALQAEVATLSTDAQRLMEVFSTTGSTATARLVEAEAILQASDIAIAQVTETMISVDQAAVDFDTLMAETGAPLLAEARVAVAQATEAIGTINAAAQTDLPAIVADIREATATARSLITDVAEDLTSASGRVDDLTLAAEAAFTEVATTFDNANTTLAAINSAMEVGTRTLEAAEGAFVGAERLINEDIDGIITGLERSLGSLDSTIALVAQDIPEITGDLREASNAAEGAFEALQSVVAQSGASITEFAGTGLPAYTRLAIETRELIRNLDRLTQQIQRDPARFFLDQRTPEFRR